MLKRFVIAAMFIPASSSYANAKGAAGMMAVPALSTIPRKILAIPAQTTTILIENPGAMPASICLHDLTPSADETMNKMTIIFLDKTGNIVQTRILHVNDKTKPLKEFLKRVFNPD